MEEGRLKGGESSVFQISNARASGAERQGYSALLLTEFPASASAAYTQRKAAQENSTRNNGRDNHDKGKGKGGHF